MEMMWLKWFIAEKVINDFCAPQHIPPFSLHRYILFIPLSLFLTTLFSFWVFNKLKICSIQCTFHIWERKALTRREIWRMRRILENRIVFDCQKLLPRKGIVNWCRIYESFSHKSRYFLPNFIPQLDWFSLLYNCSTIWASGTHSIRIPPLGSKKRMIFIAFSFDLFSRTFFILFRCESFPVQPLTICFLVRLKNPRFILLWAIPFSMFF